MAEALFGFVLKVLAGYVVCILVGVAGMREMQKSKSLARVAFIPLIAGIALPVLGFVVYLDHNARKLKAGEERYNAERAEELRFMDRACATQPEITVLAKSRLGEEHIRVIHNHGSRIHLVSGNAQTGYRLEPDGRFEREGSTAARYTLDIKEDGIRGDLWRVDYVLSDSGRELGRTHIFFQSFDSKDRGACTDRQHAIATLLTRVFQE